MFPSWIQRPSLVRAGRYPVGLGRPSPAAGSGGWTSGVLLDHLRMDPGHVVVGRDRLEEAGRHLLPPPRALAHVERGGDASDKGHRRRVTGALHRHVVRPFPGILLREHHHSTALGGHHCVIALVMGVGPVRPETGQSGVDQRRMAGAQALVVDTDPFGDPGTEALHDHIGEPGQALGLLPALRTLQVEDDALLAAVPLEGARRLRKPLPVRRHHLDDFGTEVGHHHAGDPSGHPAGEIENRDPVKYLRHGPSPEFVPTQRHGSARMSKGGMVARSDRASGIKTLATGECQR